MKRSKKYENAIVFQFLFNIILLLIFLVVIFVYILPKLNLISDLKLESNEKYSELSKINIEGLSYSDFKKEYKEKVSDNIYLSELLQELDEKFYDSNFKNKDGNYIDFLNKIKVKYGDLSDFEEKEKEIKNILPFYSENNVNILNDQLNDYTFINYIERLLETFNIDYKNSIGINRTIFIEKFNASGNSGLDSSIYYIPLKFEISGSKKDILEFIYFIENSGTIDIINDKIILNKDYKYINGKVLDGDLKTPGYNIFNNQLVDIESVGFKTNFDSSFIDVVGNGDFINYLIKYQGNEKFDLSLNLRFYVRGLPSYKIEESINNILNDFYSLQKKLTKEISKKTYTKIEKDILLDYNSTIKNLSKDIQNIKKLLNKKENLEELFNDTIGYSYIINDILVDLEKQLGITMK